MQDKLFTDLFDLVQALAGVDSFTPAESSKVIALANRRLYEAYNQSQSWTRYLVVGEERTLASQSIPFAEAGLDTISDFLRIHRTQPFLNLSAVEYEFYVDAAGANILNPTDSSPTTAFATYKKVWDGPYDVSRTDVPMEFFYFGAHATFADFLRMDGQLDKAMAEETVAQGYLASELQKAESQRNNNITVRRISTHLSRQSR